LQLQSRVPRRSGTILTINTTSSYYSRIPLDDRTVRRYGLRDFGSSRRGSILTQPHRCRGHTRWHRTLAVLTTENTTSLKRPSIQLKTTRVGGLYTFAER